MLCNVFLALSLAYRVVGSGVVRFVGVSVIVVNGHGVVVATCFVGVVVVVFCRVCCCYIVCFLLLPVSL